MAIAAALLLTGCGLKDRPPAERLAVAEPSPGSTPVATAPAPTAEPSVGPASPSSSPSALSVRPSPSAPPASAPPASAAPADPSEALALVGRWHVDAPGAAAGTALVLGEDLAVFLPCGVLDGAWEADGRQSLFIASTYGGDSTCFAGPGSPTPTWLTAARGFAVDGEQRLLLDAAGRAVVRLRPGARPTVGPNRSEDAAAEPQVTPELRARLADPAPLPRDARPVTPEQLQRRWVPVDVGNAKVHLTFSAGGDYTGSDGCNGQGGRYALGGQGRLLATGGPSTAIGCDGAPVGAWADGAARAGLVGEELVLYDSAGEVLGRLRTG